MPERPYSTDDETHMRRALELAGRARGRTAPNPMVGCVLVVGGAVVGEGWHHRAGLPHAEVDALSRISGGDARGATAYVTLEPCNHTGRTGPCSEALIAAGVSRVVAAMADPNPRVAGGGARRLRAAGIPVDVGLLEDEALAQNAGFVKWVRTGRPRVTLKAAITLDGRLATSTGDSRWVTGEEARLEVHRLRDACDAILVGATTVKADDPALTTRLPAGAPDLWREDDQRDPLRVILDGKLSIPLDAQVVRAGTLIVTSALSPVDKVDALRARGAEVALLPAMSAGDAAEAGRVSLTALLDELGRRDVLELLVEGGGVVHGAFVAAGLADRMIAFVAPRLVGNGGVPLLRFAEGAGPRRMADAFALRRVSMRQVGGDMMLTGFFDADAAARASSDLPSIVAERA